MSPITSNISKMAKEVTNQNVTKNFRELLPGLLARLNGTECIMDTPMMHPVHGMPNLLSMKGIERNSILESEIPRVASDRVLAGFINYM